MSKTILRKRVQIDCSEPKLTDQSGKKSADINFIMKQYAKTGMLPVAQKLGQYIDTTGLPSLEEAHNIILNAKNMFKELPSNIRKLIDNDPKKLNSFILDPKNREILEKEGVILKKAESVHQNATQPSVSAVVQESVKQAE